MSKNTTIIKRMKSMRFTSWTTGYRPRRMPARIVDFNFNIQNLPPEEYYWGLNILENWRSKPKNQTKVRYMNMVLIDRAGKVSKKNPSHIERLPF